MLRQRDWRFHPNFCVPFTAALTAALRRWPKRSTGERGAHGAGVKHGAADVGSVIDAGEHHVGGVAERAAGGDHGDEPRPAVHRERRNAVESVEDASFEALGALAAPSPVAVSGAAVYTTGQPGLGLRFTDRADAAASDTPTEEP